MFQVAVAPPVQDFNEDICLITRIANFAGFPHIVLTDIPRMDRYTGGQYVGKEIARTACDLSQCFGVQAHTVTLEGGHLCHCVIYSHSSTIISHCVVSTK